VEASIKREEDLMKNFQEKNDQLLNNFIENDEDFIEYILDPKTKFTFEEVKENNSQFDLTKKDNGLIGMDMKECESVEFQLTLKKPLVISAIKIGLTCMDENDNEGKEDDDACLEMNVKLIYTKDNSTEDTVTITFDKL